MGNFEKIQAWQLMKVRNMKQERKDKQYIMTAAYVMDVIARLPGCGGEAANAISAYTQVKMEDAPS